MWIPPPPSFNCTLKKIKEYLSDCEVIRYKANQNSQNNNLEVKLNPSTSNSIPDLSQKTLDNVFDDENALFALYCAKYDMNAAKRKAPFDWPSVISVNGARLTYQQPWKHFTQEECVEFEHGIRTYGKNFFQISTRLVSF